MSHRFALAVVVAAVAACALPASSVADEIGFEPTFSIGGYLSSQVGMFFSPYDAKEARDRDANRVYSTDHGGRTGELSMFRNTLFIEADWQPWSAVSLHAIFRGVRSLPVPSDDRYAEPPFPDKSGDFGDWVRDTYYSETDLREIYLAIEATDWWSMRIGKQQVSWGELGQYRLMDVVNPTDTTWHFGPLESFEDTRIPLWMLESLFEVRPLQGALEIVWIPLIDSPDRRVTTPLTFTGAWGLPTAPVQENKGIAADKIHSKTFMYPGGDIEDSRIGARWKGEIGPVTYSLAYMYTHQLTPPIPRYHVAPWKSGDRGVDIYLDFPRQHIAGFSLEVPFESPLGMVMRIEAAYEPNRTFPKWSLGAQPVRQVPSTTSTEPGAVDAITEFTSMQKQVVTYGVQFLRPTMIRFLNPTQNFILVLQFMHSMVVDFDAKDHLITVPGFDTTKLQQHSFTIVGVITTNYLNGLIQPVLVGAYLCTDATTLHSGHSGFLSTQLRFVIGNHWRLQGAVNMFWGDNPYNSVGFFRDRDEVNLKVSYQF